MAPAAVIRSPMALAGKPTTSSASSTTLRGLQRLHGSGLEAGIRRLADNPGEFRLAPEQLAKIDDVEPQQRALRHRDDRCVAGIAGQKRDLAEEVSRPK